MSLQLKFGLSYIAVIALVLIVLNTYPLLVSEDLVFRSKDATVSSSVKVISSALGGLSQLTEANVTKALDGLEETGVSRILVTDSAGQVLYDTRQEESAVGQYVFYSEIAQALEGNDAFYCSFTGGAFLSRGAGPVVYRNQTIGAVYAYQYDAQQGTLLKDLEKNLLVISAIVAAAVLLLSFLLSRMFSGRISQLLQSIRQVRDGAYSHRAEIRGGDEIAQIAAEFNSLTDRLQTTEDARRRFVSDASHEMKTPLAGICLLTDSILQTDDMGPATTREFVADIGSEAQRLSRITEDLLRLTRLDSEKLEPPVKVLVSPVLQRVLRMLRMVARERGVELSYTTDESAAVSATEGDIHQILYNLIENGIKYSFSGGCVRTRVAVEDGSVVITVEDQGVGIPEEDMPHIFERFYRVDKARSRQIGGTGLGLSIVQDTVRRRGGSVSAAAREGGGTVFTVCLPLYREGTA